MLQASTGLPDQAVGSVISAAGPDTKFVLIPDADLLFKAEFKRAGPDLILTGEDGKKTLVLDYFSHEKALPLLTPNGSGLQPDVVELLAGSRAAGQYAQAGSAAVPAAIGTVQTLVGNVNVIRNGATVTLKIGDPVYKSDVVQTGSGSAVGINFLDGTALHLTANTRMTLNDYAYDASSTSNVALFNLVEGTFSFVAGQVAKTGDMKIGTPVATMGIRGTTGWVQQQVATITANVGGVSYSFAIVNDQNTAISGIYDLIDSNGNIIFTVSEKGQLTLLTSPGIGQAVQVTTQPMTPAQFAFEQQIIQGVWNAMGQQGLTPRFDPGHDGTLQPGTTPQNYQYTPPTEKAQPINFTTTSGPGGNPQNGTFTYVQQPPQDDNTPSGDDNVDPWVGPSPGTPIGGGWGPGANWGKGAPTSTSIVSINLPVGQAVTVDGTVLPTLTVAIAGLLNLGGGALNLVNGVSLDVGGSLTNEGDILVDPSTMTVHDGVVHNNAGTITATNSGTLVAFDHDVIVNKATISADNHGQITFSQSAIHITSTGVIVSDGGDVSFDTVTIANEFCGRIVAQCDGSMSFSTVDIDSSGLIQSKSGSQITFEDFSLHNTSTGIVEAKGCDSLIIFTGGDVLINDGILEARYGGELNFFGATIDNTHDSANDGVIRALGSDSVVELYNTYVIGGTIEGKYGGTIIVETGDSGSGDATVFDGSHHIANDVDSPTLGVSIYGQVLVDDDSSLMLKGDIHLHGNIEIDPVAGGSHLVIGETVTLDGGGHVTIVSGSDSIVGAAGTTNVLHNCDMIEGTGSIGDGGANDLTVVNESCGVIKANDPTSNLIIDTGLNVPHAHDVVNHGLLEATDGGTLTVLSNVDNGCGNIEASSNGHVIFGGEVNGGDATIKDGLIEFDGQSWVDTSFTCNFQGALVVNDNAEFHGVISDFTTGDYIEFKGIDADCAHLSFCESNGLLTVSDGDSCYTVELAGCYTDCDFRLFDTGDSNASVTLADSAPEARSDSIIASDSALQCGSLIIPSSILLANDQNALFGDPNHIDSVCGACGPDDDGNITDHLGNSNCDTFSYTIKDCFLQEASTAQVHVDIQCGSLNGTCNNEIFMPGGDDACLRGNGGNDAFVFQADLTTGKYNINDFTAHSQCASDADTIDLENCSCINSFADVLDRAHDCGGSVVIDLGICNTITLQGTCVAQLSAADFSIHQSGGVTN